MASRYGSSAWIEVYTIRWTVDSAHSGVHTAMIAAQTRSVVLYGTAGFIALGATLARPVAGQEGPAVSRTLSGDSVSSVRSVFRSAADSAEWARARGQADAATGLRVVVSLHDRRLWVIRDADTIRIAEAAVASGLTVEFAGRSWTFRTPRGRHSVLRKVEDPVWRPPDWLYAEAAIEHGLKLQKLVGSVPVGPNEILVIRNGRVGILDKITREFASLPTDEHVVFNNTLFIPPVVTRNRQVTGELGRYALDLGDGYLIHGTADPQSIGQAVTHGCIRLGDDDIAWLYRNVPMSTPVHIY